MTYTVSQRDKLSTVWVWYDIQAVTKFYINFQTISIICGKKWTNATQFNSSLLCFMNVVVGAI